MLITVQESEMYIDPYMVLHGKLYSKWWTKMMPLFHKFLDDLSEDEYQILEKKIDKEFGKKRLMMNIFQIFFIKFYRKGAFCRHTSQ